MEEKLAAGRTDMSRAGTPEERRKRSDSKPEGSRKGKSYKIIKLHLYQAGDLKKKISQ